MPLLVVYNPVCGDGSAKTFFEETVLPFLKVHGKTVDKLAVTENPPNVGTVVLEFLESVEGDTTVVLGSGDGTLHEIINTISSAELKGVRASAPPSPLRFVLVPCGTANALYSSLFHPPKIQLDSVSYKLKSLQAFVDGSTTIPLTLAISSLSPPPWSKCSRPKVAISSVVTSTSLHASILHESETLRTEMPGIERFKVAAQNNISKWYTSYVKLLPVPSVGVVQIYDPAKKDFVPHEESHLDDPIVDVDGPFAYFLSTVNVDRLEPAFRITPLHSTIPPTSASFDIVMVRPSRDPSLNWDTPRERQDARQAFVQKATTVLQGAYKNGIHVSMRYGKDGEIELDGVGPTIVEYIRCGGWEWIPVSHSHQASHV
jgi:Diacylglycerol kinase catalytic domain